MCNASFVGRAGLSWLSLEDPSGAIEVVSIEDITNSTVTSLTANSYGSTGSNYFAYTNPLEIGDATSTFDDICNVIRKQVKNTASKNTSSAGRIWRGSINDCLHGPVAQRLER